MSEQVCQLSWSCSRWREASGIKFRLQKAELWISRKPALDAALKATPTAKVASSAQFLQHIRHRMQHTAAAQAHHGDRRHRQLRWRSFIKRQQAYSAICKTISGGSSDTAVAYGDAKFSSSCCKGNPRSAVTVHFHQILRQTSLLQRRHVQHAMQGHLPQEPHARALPILHPIFGPLQDTAW
ncbi:TPA: hypothetical protein ACH3X1_002415 [Trebouxia sp. C0004]